MEDYKVILFDLDGTLTDPKLGITKGVEHALNHFGIHVDSLDDLTRFIGPPLYDSFYRFYGFNKERVEKAVTLFREYYADKGIFENYIYPGILPLLEKLKNQGKTLIVATSKPEVFAEKIIKHFKMDHCFTAINGSEFSGVHSNKTELIKYILDDLDYDKSEVLMVGDRKHDIIGAVNNGIDSLGVNYGYSLPGELKEAGATYIKNSVDELGEFFSVMIH